LAAAPSQPVSVSEEEIIALIKAAGALSSPLRAPTSQSLIGLRSATGMRVGKAINLDRQDFDACNGTLIIRGRSSIKREKSHCTQRRSRR
jgi:integrase